MSPLLIALQSVHVLFAVVWLGTLIDSELFLWPLLTRLNALHVQEEMRSKKGIGFSFEKSNVES